MYEHKPTSNHNTSKNKIKTKKTNLQLCTTRKSCPLESLLQHNHLQEKASLVWCPERRVSLPSPKGKNKRASKWVPL